MTSVGNELQAGKNKALKSLAQLAGDRVCRHDCIQPSITGDLSAGIGQVWYFGQPL